jgi:hypothetical protein
MKRQFRWLALLALMISGGSRATILMPNDDCSSALQPTFLEFKFTGTYYVKDKERSLDLALINKKLRARNLKELPEKVTIGFTSGKLWDDLMARIEAAQELWPQELHMLIDRAYLYEMPEICYHGSPARVMRLIEKMSGKFFHGDQGYFAIRYGHTKTILDPENFAEDSKLNERFPDREDIVDEWLNYNPLSSDVLILSNLGPQGDGTEVYSTRIRRCPSI